MKRLNRDDIVAGLTELATRMDAASIAARIHVIGGSAISIEYNHFRESTVDVDSWLYVDETLIDAVGAIVRDIAVVRQWPDDWFNSKAQMFLPDHGEPFAWRPLLDVGAVRVLVAPPDLLLAMKLLAGRGRRDLPDLAPLLAACEIVTVGAAVALFDSFYPNDEMSGKSAAWLKQNLSP